MDMQNISNLVIPDGEVRTVHDKDSRLLWGRVNYDTKYAGDIFQQTYSGKNLCDSFAATKASWQSGNLTVDPDGSIIVSNNPGSNNYFALGQTLGDLCPSLAIGDVAYLRLLTNSVASGRIYIGENWFDGYSKTITQNMLDASVVIYGGYGQTDNIKIMITKDSLSQTYEQYVGGIASPNPDYPQDIQVVAGEQTVTISDGTNSEDHKVNLTSKNLFDKYTAVNTSSNYYLNPDETISTTASDYQTGRRYMTMSLAAGSYCLSYKPYFSGVNSPKIRYTIRNMDASTDIVAGYENSPINGQLYSLSFTITDSITLGICIMPVDRLETGQSFYFDETQLEQGDQATTYQPHYNYELAKIGTYQDYIYNSGEDWYVHKEIGKIVLNGNEDWRGDWQNGSTPDHWITYLRKIDFTDNYQVSNGTNTKCNYFSPSTQGNSVWNLKGYGFALNSDTTYTLQFKMAKSFISAVLDWKTWLSTHNTIVYYALATPTDTKITDSTLIGQLNAIHEWLTRYGYLATVTGNLPIIIDQTPLA